jgi:MFS family permease
MWLSMVFLVCIGCGMLVSLAGSNTILQTIVDDDKRGRLMSFYTMAFMGMTPWGSLVAGALASRLGAPMAVRIGGIACIAGATLFAVHLPRLREIARPIYANKGITSLPGSGG